VGTKARGDAATRRSTKASANDDQESLFTNESRVGHRLLKNIARRINIEAKVKNFFQSADSSKLSRNKVDLSMVIFGNLCRSPTGSRKTSEEAFEKQVKSGRAPHAENNRSVTNARSR